MKPPINYKKSIVNIPGTILENLGFSSKRKFEISLGKRIVWIIVDGLGWREFLRKRHLFHLKGFNVEKIYSVFPSSTVPALSSLYTGLTPQEHGFLEWTIFDGRREIEVFLDKDYKISEFFSGKTVFELLGGEKRVKVFLKIDYFKSRISKRFFRRCKVDFYIKESDLFAKILKEREFDILFAYYDFKDILDHIYGRGLETYFELKVFGMFLRKVSKKGFSLILSSDHGIFPRTKYIYLSKLGMNRRIKGYSGGHRDFFLFTKRDIFKELKEKLSDKFLVERSEKLLKDGWFGIGRIQKNFRRIIGDVSIVSIGEHNVKLKKGGEFLGMHGGITEEEIFVPLIWRE